MGCWMRTIKHACWLFLRQSVLVPDSSPAALVFPFAPLRVEESSVGAFPTAECKAGRGLWGLWDHRVWICPWMGQEKEIARNDVICHLQSKEPMSSILSLHCFLSLWKQTAQAWTISFPVYAVRSEWMLEINTSLMYSGGYTWMHMRGSTDMEPR